MDVTITQFRRHLFKLVSNALDGQELWVSHKGRRIRLAPEPTSTTRFSRVTPLQIVSNPADDLVSSSDLTAEMQQAWEHDWSSL